MSHHFKLSSLPGSIPCNRSYYIPFLYIISCKYSSYVYRECSFKNLLAFLPIYYCLKVYSPLVVVEAEGLHNLRVIVIIGKMNEVTKFILSLYDIAVTRNLLFLEVNGSFKLPGIKAARLIFKYLKDVGKLSLRYNFSVCTLIIESYQSSFIIPGNYIIRCFYCILFKFFCHILYLGSSCNCSKG